MIPSIVLLLHNSRSLGSLAHSLLRLAQIILKPICLNYAVLIVIMPSGALHPNLIDLWFLYQTVRSGKPKIILEFGSCCPTIALADDRFILKLQVKS